MKMLLLAFLIPMSAFAINCEVDGISDSPQKLNCYIHDGSMIEKLNLSCSDGRYRIAWKGKNYDVDMAYHEEVESGSNPLVFVSGEISLTTVSHRVYSRAKLTASGKSIDGLCFDK